MRTPRIPWRQPDVPPPVSLDEVVAFGARLLRDRDALAAERDHARRVIEETRRALKACTYFAGAEVDDVVQGVDALATAYEAERGRP